MKLRCKKDRENKKSNIFFPPYAQIRSKIPLLYEFVVVLQLNTWQNAQTGLVTSRRCYWSPELTAQGRKGMFPNSFAMIPCIAGTPSYITDRWKMKISCTFPLVTALGTTTDFASPNCTKTMKIGICPFLLLVCPANKEAAMVVFRVCLSLMVTVFLSHGYKLCFQNSSGWTQAGHHST